MTDVPLAAPDFTLYTDGTSFMQNRIRKAGYAVVILEEVCKAQSLPPGTSAQLAELHALTRALELSEGKCINIYTDSKHAFLTVQVHEALYKERGLITAVGKDVKYGPQILTPNSVYQICLEDGKTYCYKAPGRPIQVPRDLVQTPKDPLCPNNCPVCIKTVLKGRTITTTLVYHTHYQCLGKHIPCCFKGT